MVLEMITTLLKQRVGFDAKIIGDRKISRAVENRQVACRVSSPEAYLQVLQSSPQELDELVEQLVVPETWFFRDRKPFDCLIQFVQSQWRSKTTRSKLRVLSLPCSTGEEPYSIAIALLEAGLSTHQFSIDAIDISQQALIKARQGIYGKNSFRGEDWVDRSVYFQSIDGKYQVCQPVRESVKFRQGNLLDPSPKSSANYDVIFCRNVLIYLEDSACKQIFNTLHQMLTPDGLLFVGASETGKVPSDRFSYIRQAFTFAYQKIEFNPEQSFNINSNLDNVQKHHLETPPSLLPKTKVIAVNRRAAQTMSLKSQVTYLPTINLPNHTELRQAQELADAGQLNEAIQCCKTYLEHHSTNAEAHALLGTLYQATANYEQAERCFQKALYLQPNFYEALMNLALLKESRGDAIAAQRLRQRIQKLQTTS